MSIWENLEVGSLYLLSWLPGDVNMIKGPGKTIFNVNTGQYSNLNLAGKSIQISSSAFTEFAACES